MSLIRTLRKKLRPLTVADHIRRLAEGGEVKVALDIGCGGYSPLTALRPKVITVGVDIFPEAIESAKSANRHDHYLLADVLKDDLQEQLFKQTGLKEFDLVCSVDVIEHLPKKKGYLLLERCEELTSKYVICQTPHGFVEQGPEFGNEFQRHHSGWFIQDFEGLAYKVFGSFGTKYLRGYGALPKYNFPGAARLDEALTVLLQVTNNPQHAFNLIAIKDIRGVPARLTDEYHFLAQNRD